MKQFNRIMIAVCGTTVVAIGIAMIVFPGPAIIVIPAGLAILAVEFAWARRWIRVARAALPGHSSEGIPAGRFSMRSNRRRVEFLFRRIRRALLTKEKPV